MHEAEIVGIVVMVDLRDGVESTGVHLPLAGLGTSLRARLPLPCIDELEMHEAETVRVVAMVGLRDRA